MWTLLEMSLVEGGGEIGKPPMQPIPVRRPFQLLGVDVMDLPKTESSNISLSRLSVEMATSVSHTILDQKSKHNIIVEIFIQKIVPAFGVFCQTEVPTICHS